MCLGVCAPSQCLAMEDLDGLKEEINNISIHARISDEVSDDEKMQWVEAQPFNILAAEDSPISTLLLKRFFAKPNTIVVFGNGQELLNEIERPTCKFHPSFIITDGNMPVLNGWEAIEKLKKNKNCPPIFALADSDEEERRRFLELGVAAFVKKPVSKGPLFCAIYDVFHSLKQNQGK